MSDRPAPSRTPAPLPPDQVVSASELVRYFGQWQERAARAPVYILHRGRPRLALTTIELMEALCTPCPVETGTSPLFDAVLDAVHVPLIVIDFDATIVAASRSAAMLAGQDRATIVGGFLDSAWPDRSGRIATAAARVIATGQPDCVVIARPRDDRQMRVAIDPLPRGALLSVTDVTIEEEHADLAAERKGTEQALLATRTARARINLRGAIEAPGDALAALTGLDRAALTGQRFAMLFDVTSRVAVGDAIERCFADGIAHAITATLLVNRGDVVPLTLGLGPIHRSRRVEALAAIFLPRHDFVSA